MLLLLLTQTGCGDSCQQLCRAVADRFDACIDQDTALAWVDLRAQNREDFIDLCEQEWDDARRQLSSFDRTAALQACCDTVPEFDRGRGAALGCDDPTPVLTCDQVVALYRESP